MIIIDFSQVAIANIFGFSSDIKKASSSKEVMNIVRHAILSGIKSYKKMFPEYNTEVVIACDGWDYWRKSVFPYYKSNRQKKREQSDINWNIIHDCMNKMQKELSETFPYKVIRLQKAEADDVIGVLSLYTINNNVRTTGLFSTPNPVLVIGSDKDYHQLHADGVQQWCPTTKKKVVVESANVLNTHIAKGDTIDTIPNVLSDDDTIITEGKRQKRMMANRLEQFTKMGRDACLNSEEKRNWNRNEVLISFEHIPEEVKLNIIDYYENVNTKRDLSAIMKYLMSHRCAQLLDDIESF